MVSLFLLAWLAVASAQQDLSVTGREAFESGDYPRAEAVYRRYVEQHPTSAEGLSNLGAVLARLERFEEAIESYDKALHYNPKLSRVYFNLGVACLRAGQYARAVGALERYRKAYPADARAQQLLGTCLVETGEFRRAIALLEKVNETQPGQVSVLFALATAAVRAGERARGEEILSQIEKASGQAPQVQLLHGLLDYRTGEYERAEAEFQEAVRLDARLAPAWAGLGRLRFRLNQDAEAIEFLSKAVELAPQDAESTYQLGVLLDRHGSPRGQELMRHAIALRPDYADALYFLAKSELAAGKPAAALPLLDRALKSARQVEAIHFLRARTLQELGRRGESEAEFREFRRLEQDRIHSLKTIRKTDEEPTLPLDRQ
jgi:tetratricopeptide (TPR) repeat protein